MERIKLSFYDKTYTIEYANRMEVKSYFAQLGKYAKQGEEDNYENGIKALTLLLKAGLVEHHKNEMPSDEELERWATSIPNPEVFYDKLMSMIKEVMSVMEEDTKNLKWEVEEA